MHTQYANFTDEELLRAFCAKDEPTDLEVELALRFEQMLDSMYGEPEIELDDDTKLVVSVRVAP